MAKGTQIVLLNELDEEDVYIVDPEDDYVGMDILTYSKKWYVYDCRENEIYYYREAMAGSVDDKDVVLEMDSA
jgi:hypothetical protein